MTNNRKILFIATVEDHILSFHLPFLQYFQNNGYEAHVACKFGERREELEKKGIICHNIDFSRSVNPFFALKSLKQLIKLMKENSFSLVHVHTPMAAFLGRLAAKLTNTRPILYTAHGFHFFRGAPWYYWAFIYPAECLAGKWTDGLIVINQEDFENAQRMGFQTQKNLFFVKGVGVPLKEIIKSSLDVNNDIRKELGIREGDIIITCIAEFIPRKNHLFLLKAWSEIARRYDNIHLLLVGKGKLFEYIKQYVEINMLPRVYFLGYRRNIPQIILVSDIVTLVSKREGLPRTIMEAMALGKAVIASNVRGNRDLIDNGKNGLLVEPGKEEDLVNALKKIIDHDELRVQMGKLAIEKIKEYDLEKILNEMSSIYEYYLKMKIK